MQEQAFQDRIPDNYCFGCGPHNEAGLHLKSFWDGDETVAVFTPGPQHAAGPRQFLNGGVIATVIDCHCVCTAIADAYRREGRDIGEAPRLWYATASLKIDYLKPAPIDRPLTLRARIVETTERKTRLACSAVIDGVEYARGDVLAVRVPPDWAG